MLPKVSRKLFLYKRKRKNVRNVLSETPLPLAINLHTGSISKGSRSLRGRPYKKEKKRMLKTFLEKPTPISTSTCLLGPFLKVPEVQEAVFIKKMRKER